MKNTIKFFFISFLLSGTFGVAFADTSIHLKISTNSGFLYDHDITVTPCDSDNHGTMKTTAYCAVLQSGLSNNWSWYGTGAFLNSLGGISGFTSQDANGNPVYHYWNWSANGVGGMTGLNEYNLQPSDSILINFIDPGNITPISNSGGEPLMDEKSLNVSNLYNFNNEKAVAFLVKNQKKDGSFGDNIYTDWTTLALSPSDKYEKEKTKLKEYLLDNKLPKNSSLTDYERRAISLMSLGINPYSANGENYIEKIVAGFDGDQFGNIAEINDDIFALIVLENAGYNESDALIKSTLNLILTRQEENGSWDGNVDMTGAGMEAIEKFKNEKAVILALERGKKYLKEKQVSDGGFGNISSTAWTMEGILALGENPLDWKKHGNSPFTSLGSLQENDGGITGSTLENRIWQTAYASSVASGKTWNQIMQNFRKLPEVQPEPNTQIVSKENKEINQTPELKIKEIEKNPNITKKFENKIETPTPTNKNWFQRIIEKLFGI